MGEQPDTQRQIGDLVRLGIVASVDHAAATCRVKVGDITTGDLPWFAGRAGATRSWSPPNAGEQVLLLCPESDTAAGLVVTGLYSDVHPAPSALEHLELMAFADDGEISYDAENHALVVKLPDTATVRVSASGGIVIEAPGGLSLDGSLRVAGNLAVDIGASGTFSTPTGQVVTVQSGIVTAIA